jgi:hypothetical protein
LVIVVASFGWLIPLALLIGALSGASWVDSVRRFPKLSLLMGATWLAQASLLMGAVWLFGYAARGFDTARSANVIELAGGALAVGGIWALAVAHDAVRVMLFPEANGVNAALRRAWPLLCRVRTWGAAAWRTALALSVTFAALAAGLALARRPAFIAVMLHLASLAIYVWLRASWLRWLIQRSGVK